MNYVLFISFRVCELFLPHTVFHTSSFLVFFCLFPLVLLTILLSCFFSSSLIFCFLFLCLHHSLYLKFLGNALLQLASHYQPTIAQHLQTVELLKTDHMHIFYLNCKKDAVNNCKSIMDRCSKSSSF